LGVSVLDEAALMAVLDEHGMLAEPTA